MIAYDTIAPMAKKKHQSKKHTFKYAEPGISPVAIDSSQLNSAPKGLVTTSGVVGRDFSYVASDLRRILVIGGSLVLAEFVLWYLFGHTSLGTHVYDLIHL